MHRTPGALCDSGSLTPHFKQTQNRIVPLCARARPGAKGCQTSPQKASSHRALGTSFKMLWEAQLFQACREKGEQLSLAKGLLSGGHMQESLTSTEQKGHPDGRRKAATYHPNFCLPASLPRPPNPRPSPIPPLLASYIAQLLGL